MPQRPLDPSSRSTVTSIRLAAPDFRALALLRSAWGCRSDAEAIRRAIRLAAAEVDPEQAAAWRWSAARAAPSR